MKKIDWYILQKFLTTFFFSIFLFAVVSVVVDISEKADDFVKSGLTTKQIVMQYYIGFVPHIVALLFPLFVFIAVIFFTSKMAGRSEIIAIIASGTTYNRWMRPYWMGGILLGLLLFYANHYVVPNANKIRGAFEAKYVDANSSYENLIKSRGNDLYFRIDSVTYAGMYNYDTVTKRGGPFFLNRIKNNKMYENIRSDAVQWDTAKKNWRLEKVYQRDILGVQEKVTNIPLMNMNFNLKPADFVSDKYTKDKLSSPELRHLINVGKVRGSEGLNELEVEASRRDAAPVTVILLTIIGAVIAGRKVRGGSGLHLATGFIIAAAFILTDRFSTVFSTKGNLSPVLAAWIPNIIFVFVVFYLYRKAPK